MSVYKLTVLEEQQCRDTSDVICHRNIVTLIYIALADLCLALILCIEFVNDRSNSLTWTAPCRPKVDNYRLVSI
jgi:hypothetical protein